MIMRLVTTIAAILSVLAFLTPPLSAQCISQNLCTDSSFRVEYLLGTQTLGNNGKGTFLLYAQNPPPTAPPLPSTNYFRYSYQPSGIAQPNPIEILNIKYSNSLPVVDGMVELTPIPAVSSRLRGSVSVLKPNSGFTLESGPVPVLNVATNPNPPPATLPTYYAFTYVSISTTPPLSGSPPSTTTVYDEIDTYGWAGLSAVLNPQYLSWEVAGLYNLCYEGCYRYSFVAGYRQEQWKFPTSSGQENNSYLLDKFVGQMPFIGLQTLMFSPTWKARFEVLGSPFMTKKITHTAHTTSNGQVYYMNLDGTMTNGGLIEFQVEGNVNVARGIWMGVYSQYSDEQFRGELTGTSVDGNGYNPNTVPIVPVNYVTHPYDFVTCKDIWLIGLNCNVLF